MSRDIQLVDIMPPEQDGLPLEERKARGLFITALCKDDKAQLDRIEAALARIDWSHISTDSAAPAPFHISAADSQCPTCGAPYVFGMPGPVYRTCDCSAVGHLPRLREVTR